MSPRLRIISYFSLPTDLAAEMEHWPEYVSGNGYNVNLRNPEGDEVEVRFHEDSEEPYILLSSTRPGLLQDRVAGLVAYALSAHSDYIMVYRRDDRPNQAIHARAKRPA